MMKPQTAIVIGGGIAGCSTAYSLAKRGMHVTLFEQNATIASEASGNPIAMLYPRLSGNNAASEFALAGYLHSVSLLKSLLLPAGAANHCGMLQLGFNARELARIQKVAAQQHPAQVLKYVNAVEASALANIPLKHDALYFPDAAWVNPKVLCEQLTQHYNIEVFTLTKVNKLLKYNYLFEVYSDNIGVKKADIVVIANANNAQHLTQTSHLKTQAVRGQLSQLTTTTMSQALNTILCSDGYLSPAINHEHLLGATFSPDNHDLSVINTDHLSNLATLKSISTALHENLQANIINGRAAIRCTSPDYFPLVGAILNAEILTRKPPRPTATIETLPWVQGLYINIAHGSRGFSSAPLCAELLACLICNEALPIPAPLAGLLNPNRFILRELGLKRLAKMSTFSSLG